MTSRTGRTVRRVGEAAYGLHFFAGKGGVGKTTCAAATALAVAERGRRVALISTDPAHSLGDALGRRLAPTPHRVPTRTGVLDAVELDADRALARWLARRRPMLRMIAERGTYLDEEDLERVLRLSFPGVDELMALVELTRLAERGGWQQVVVDTATRCGCWTCRPRCDAWRRRWTASTPSIASSPTASGRVIGPVPPTASSTSSTATAVA
jgi:anion-transporting ATPase